MLFNEGGALIIIKLGQKNESDKLSKGEVKMKIYKVLLSITLFICGLFLGAALIVKLDLDEPTKAVIFDESQRDKNDPEELSTLRSLEEAFIRVAEEVGPAVVSIISERTQTVGGEYFFSPFGDDFFERFFKEFFGEIPKRKFRSMGLGSGIIIDPNGYILTNEHVIHGADKITVTLPDGREFKAKLVGKDYRADLAVLKIDAKNLPYAKLGDSDKVKIGQWAIAIGNPFGFAVKSPKPTVTVGVISALHRTLPATEYRDRIYTDLIQTDAAINPGNSGGPLLNLKGEVIGINVAIYTTSGGYQGIGFAIPINQAKYVLDKLIKGEEVEYGWLGVQIQDLNKELAEYFGLPDQRGALVAKVLKNSPAQRAGIREGDVIRKFNGKDVEDTKDLMNKVMHTEVGKVVEVEIIRDGNPMKLKVKIGKRPLHIGKAGAGEHSWRGMTVGDITEEIRRAYNITEEEGVVVLEVDPDSPAGDAGIREGDVILEVNRKIVRDLEDFIELTKDLKGKALIRTHRGYFLISE